MAVLASIATGNWTTASTWGLVDSTSYLNAENATESLLTTAYSGTRSAAFTPGAITISHIGVKLAERIGTTGTISVCLELDATDTLVTGTEVTIDVADLPSALEADLNGGWIFFKLASPVTLSAATAYQVAAKTSSATQVDLFCDATVDNIARALVTTTTQAPVAGDDLIIAGEKTGQGTGNSFTVTMNETATTDYGSASTSLATPALAICQGGTLSYGTTEATNYYLRLSGNAIVYSGGTFNIGTTGTPIPRDSTASLNFDCGANVDFGLTIRNGGTWNAQGLSRTSGKNIVSCLLSADEAANSTSLDVDTDTGWLDNDRIAVASTTRTITQAEEGTLNGNAGASSLTVDGFAGTSGGLLNAHGGVAPVQAEVVLLTRNVKIFGASSTLQTFVDIAGTASVDLDWTEFYWIGSSTTGKFGINVAVTTGSFSMQYCSGHSSTVSGSRFVNATSITGNNFVFSNNVAYNFQGDIVQIPTSSAAWVMSNNVLIYSTSNRGVFLSSISGTFTNNRIANTGSNPITFSASSNTTFNNFSNIVVHSCSQSVSMSAWVNGVITDLTIWRSNNNGISFTDGAYNIIFDGLIMFGNQTANISFVSADISGVTFIDTILNGDSTFSTSYGISFPSNATVGANLKVINGDFGSASGIYTSHSLGDIHIAAGASYVDLKLVNTKLSSSTEVSGAASITNPNTIVSSQKHDQVAGSHKAWKAYGILATEATTYRSSAPSESLTPNNASNKLESSPKLAAVANTGTRTFSVYIYKSAAYNGNQPRLVLRRNDAAGISADTVLDTAAGSTGSWEQLTGTTASVTDDAALEVFVDCDGTAGVVYVDDWSVT